LKKLAPAGEPVEAFGIGGAKLQAAGLRAVVDARELLAMGFLEVLGRLPQILRALATVTREAAAVRPELAVVIDYPDFHFRLGRRLKALGIPVVYFIPPKVWVWRKGRVRWLRERFARILCILPFEEEFYRRENVPVRYVGNPLVDELPLRLTRAEARRHLGLAEEASVLTMMLGSRPAELKFHLEVLLDAAARAATRLERRLVVLLPFSSTSEISGVLRAIQAWQAAHPDAPLELRPSQGDAHECLVAADAGVIKSGTSTLEAGLLGCPHVVVYRAGLLSRFVFHFLIRYRGPVGLVNLVAGWQPGQAPLVRELLGGEVTVGAVSAEIVALLTDLGLRSRLAQGLGELRARVVGNGDSPSLRAAREVLALRDELRQGSQA
jgi:lipid-A-disaccharide synthase